MHIDQESSDLGFLRRSRQEASSVDRPKWICGHRAFGQPCGAGPGSSGVCTATYRCTPTLLNGAWVCDRPASNGGACEAGPLADGSCCNPAPACTPIRSVQAQQDSLARWFGLAVLGIVAAAIGFSADTKLLMPGPLATSHSSIQDCSGCHANVGKGQLGWLHTLANAANPKKDNATCIACHKVGDGAMSPHGLMPRQLRANIGTQRDSDVSRDSPLIRRVRDYLLPVEKISKKEVFCATCHKEHRSAKIDMTSMSDNRCQTCHTVQFTQFDKDHPEFKSYPFARRTRIKFNHGSHIDKHFPEWNEKHADRRDGPDACASCHTTAGSKQHMKVKPFAQVCASCHLGQIVGKERASGPQGVALFALPGIDLATIKERGLSVGEWPSESEAELTPMTKFLLGGSASRRSLLTKVENLDLLDLTKASPEEVTAVVRLAWEIKRLLHALMATKTSEVMRRLGLITGVEVDQNLMTKLVATLPRDVLVNAQREWLPSLDSEVKKLHERGWEVTTASNWKVAVEPPVKPKEEAATKPASTIAKPTQDQGSADQGPPAQLLTNPKLGRWIINAVGDLVQEGDPSAAQPIAEEQSKTEAPADPTRPEADQSNAVATKTNEAPRAATVQSAVSAEAWAEFGGWYRKDYAILFKPTGHADTFMRAWLDFSGEAIGSKGARLAVPVFELLSAKDAQGQCIKCHSVDASANRSLQVQWRTSALADKKQRFTKFVHEPHFQLLDNRGCLTCHKMSKGKGFEKSYQSLNPAAVAPNFKQVEKQACATCHKESAARQDCVLCHDYHVAPVVTPMTATKLPQTPLKQ